jgi:hypothetical protein
MANEIRGICGTADARMPGNRLSGLKRLCLRLAWPATGLLIAPPARIGLPYPLRKGVQK